MTVYEFLKAEKDFIQNMNRNEIGNNAIQEMELYERFLKFLKHGDSREEIIEFMSVEYGRQLQEVKNIVEKMEREYEL